MKIQAVIFDLDGVIVSTDEYHYLAWNQLAMREKIPFNRDINQQLRGVSRMESLEIILRNASRMYSGAQKRQMSEEKNDIYRKSLDLLTPSDILPGVEIILNELKTLNIKIAIGSSSKNTPCILERIGLANSFDAVADGNDIQYSKPHPEVFLIAAQRLGIEPAACLVVEDAFSGIEAAKQAGMKVLGVGYAAVSSGADLTASSLADIGAERLLAI